MSERMEVLHLLEKDVVIAKEVEVYGDLHEDAMGMVVDDEGMMRLLVVVLQRPRLLLLPLVVAVELERRHDAAAWLLAWRPLQHLHYIAVLTQSCPMPLKNKTRS